MWANWFMPAGGAQMMAGPLGGLGGGGGIGAPFNLAALLAARHPQLQQIGQGAQMAGSTLGGMREGYHMGGGAHDSMQGGVPFKGYAGGTPNFNEGSGGWWPGPPMQSPPAGPIASPQAPTGPREAPEAHPGMADRGAGQWASGGWTPQPAPAGPQPMPLPGIGGNIAGNWQGGFSAPTAPAPRPKGLPSFTTF